MTGTSLSRVLAWSVAIALVGPPIASAQSFATTQAAPDASAASGRSQFLNSAAFLQQVQGRQVHMKLTDGYGFNGHITGVESGSVIIDGTRVSFDRIATVETSSGNRLRNSTIVGFALGMGIGGLGFALCSTEENYSDCTVNLILSPLIGTGIGLAIGAVRHGGDKTVVYDAKRWKTAMGFAPIVSPTRKGVSFSMSWR